MVNNSIFARRPAFLKWLLFLLMVLAVGIRVYNLQRPGVVPDRQYRSALIARAYYYELSGSVPEWQQQVALTSSERQEALEPQITEYLAALLYWAAGAEHLWIFRAVTALFWLIGGIPLFLIARRISSAESALYALAYYWLVPQGVLVSLSLLPESLMITAMLFGIWRIIRYFDRPSTNRLIFAAAVSGMAVLIKPLTVFTILGSFIVLAYHQKKTLRQLVDRPFLIFMILSLLPGVLFYGYGIILADYLRWKVTTSFLPHFFLSPAFWRGWLLSAAEAVEISFLIIALLGLPLLKSGLQRNLLTGLWAGYVVFCLAFNYFTYFLPYYHIQLIIIAALSLGPVMLPATAQLARSGSRWLGRSAITVTAFLLLFFSFHQVGEGHVYPGIEDKAIAAEIGEIVEHSERVAYLAYVYGLPLEYHGHLAGEHWPRPAIGWPLAREGGKPRSIGQRITMLGFTPEYFVITHFREYQRYHADLKNFLEKNGRLIAQSEHYLVYHTNLEEPE